jgi:hypothetical protein
MRLEGTLDAFSLPDIFQLLSFTKKTGALHLRRKLGEAGPELHGVVHVRAGAITGSRADVARQELARRLLGTGLVDDEALAQAAEEIADHPEASLARLLSEKADLSADAAKKVAAEQVTDAVFDLLRWPDGEFAFVVDEEHADDLGAELVVEEIVAEGTRRLESWPSIAGQVPAADTVLRINPAPADMTASPEEWALLALVDGRRTVADLVVLSGQGEYAVVTALAALVGRGLLVVGESGDDQLLRRHALLSVLEGQPFETPAWVAAPMTTPDAEPAAAPSVADQRPAVTVPSQTRSDAPVIPERPEPFTASRRPDHPEQVPARARLAGGTATATVTALGGHGSVHGATAMQPDASAEVAAVAGVVERDPSVNKSLLLRLIAGVRGL